jgi:hypothetical protein
VIGRDTNAIVVDFNLTWLTFGDFGGEVPLD